MAEQQQVSRHSKIMQEMRVSSSVAASFTRRARRCGIQIEDLRQAAAVAMIQAVDSYRADSPVPLSQHVARRVKMELSRLCGGIERENAVVEFSIEMAVAA